MQEIIDNFISTNINFYQLEYFIRILLAGICGSVIGLERRKRFKDAGIRTHLILAIGCAVIMIVSKYAFADTLDYDAARVASNIITGVGFLGAGVIFVKSGSVRGLTTAAGIWTTAAIGMAIGAGFYLLGIGVTILLVVIQLLLYRLVPALESIEVAELLIKAKRTPDILERIKAELDKNNIFISTMKIKKHETELDIRFSVKVQKDHSLQGLFELLSAYDEIIEISTNF
ncbi:MAG: MgtC/SapB family protein [Bacilli bacterium]|nr:MgtC/SapB family protein [Bacilli bacterium]